MEGKINIEDNELYIGNGIKKLGWPPSEWAAPRDRTYDAAEMSVLRFAQEHTDPAKDSTLKAKLEGKVTIIVDTEHGFPSIGEVFLQKAVEMNYERGG